MILSRIYGHGRGWVFSKTDFLDLGQGGAVDTQLFRLHKTGTIRRLLPGLYDYPRYSEALSTVLGPDIGQVALALSRKHRWQIVPDGPTALHLLGLSEQVPAQYRYFSSGPNRRHIVGGVGVEFLHRKTQHTTLSDDRGALLVQAIASIGEERMSEELKDRLSRIYSAPDYRRIVVQTRAVTTWIHDTIKEIARRASLREEA